MVNNPLDSIPCTERYTGLYQTTDHKDYSFTAVITYVKYVAVVDDAISNFVANYADSTSHILNLFDAIFLMVIIFISFLLFSALEGQL